MIQLLRFTLFFWRTYLVRTLLTKRMLLVALGCMVPPLMAWFVLTVPRHGPLPVQAFMYPSLFLVLQIMVPLAAVIGGAAVISEEIDDRTITYLLTRPIPRPSILLGRWLATLTILFAFVGTSVFTLGTIAEFKSSHPTVHPPVVERPDEGSQLDAHDERPADERARARAEARRQRRERERDEPAAVLVEAMPDHRLPSGLFAAVLTVALLGTAVYSALFAVFGTFLKHPMIAGLGYAFAIEGFLANLPGASQSWTVQYYLRSYLLSNHPALWNALHEETLAKYGTANEAVTKLAIVLAVTLLAGSLTIRRKQYELSA